MSTKTIEQNIRNSFIHKPTTGQEELILKTAAFISQNEHQAFIIKGYAGTGKTTFIAAFIKALPLIKMKFILLAPTGRSAKVLASYTREKAFTIHKVIYKVKNTADGHFRFVLQNNLNKNTVFVVDEASMIGTSDGNIHFNLLDDLIFYVKQGKGCKIIFVGDSAQLPPVKQEFSPALHENTISLKMDQPVANITLTEVVRQQMESGILFNATSLREIIRSKRPDNISVKIDTKRFSDIVALANENVADEIMQYFSSRNIDESIIITRSNALAYKYNQFIRYQVLFYEDIIATGDYIMAVKNNYYWLADDSQAGFIANGDILEILRIQKFTELYGFRFAHVTLRMPDFQDEPDFDAIVLLDTLVSKTAALAVEDQKKLFNEIMMDVGNDGTRKEIIEKVKSNHFFNAIQIKFAYAVTCHKAQGGQWKNVFVDHGFIREDAKDTGFYRWLYTAFTRATEKLFLIRFPESYFL